MTTQVLLDTSTTYVLLFQTHVQHKLDWQYISCKSYVKMLDNNL